MATPNLSFQNFYTSTLAAGISATDTTIYINSLPTGSEGYLVIEPDSSTNKEIIYYTSKGANFVTLPSVAAGRGVGGTTAVSHSSGVTVQMNVVAEHFEALQDGTAFAVGGIGASAYSDGWTPILGSTPNTVTYNGNRNYDLVFNAVDLSSTISPGQKLKLTRTVAAPTQCTSLNGTSQYYSKTTPAGMTFTDDFVVSAWIKLSSYADGVIASRYNGTSGWTFRIESTGKVYLQAYNAGAANTSYVRTYSSIPLNKWVHIAAQLDMSSFTATTTTSYILIDGVDTPTEVARAGTNPTALIQAGNLEIGSQNGGLNPFPGKLAQVAIYSGKVTQATVRASISQGLSGSETSLISAYSFNNSINDLNTTNANNLTASGSAVATNADSPYANAVTAGLQEYAEINSVTFSTNTTVNVRVPETCMIPTSGGISNVYYAVGATPTGLPYFSNVLGYAVIQVSDTTGGTAEADINGLSTTVYVPTNAKIKITTHCNCYNTTGAAYSIIKIKEGSTSYQAGLGSQAGANSPQLVTAMADLLPTAGSHTYKLSHTASSGNKAIEASTTEPAFIKVELV